MCVRSERCADVRRRESCQTTQAGDKGVRRDSQRARVCGETVYILHLRLLSNPLFYSTSPSV